MTWWWWLEAIKMVPANRIRTQRRFTKIYNESPFLRFVCHILAICAPTERTRKWKTITAIVFFFFFFLVRSQHSFLVGLIKSSANNNNGSAHWEVCIEIIIRTQKLGGIRSLGGFLLNSDEIFMNVTSIAWVPTWRQSSRYSETA